MQDIQLIGGTDNYLILFCGTPISKLVLRNTQTRLLSSGKLEFLDGSLVVMSTLVIPHTSQDTAPSTKTLFLPKKSST